MTFAITVKKLIGLKNGDTTIMVILKTPLIPLFFRSEWKCTCCGKNPCATYKSSLPVKIFALIVFSILLFLLFHPDALLAFPGLYFEDLILRWGARLSIILILLGILYSIVNPPKIFTKTEKLDSLNSIPPIDKNQCAYCHHTLNHRPNLHCPECKLRVYEN